MSAKRRNNRKQMVPLDQLLMSSKILVVCGAGGVGKTTTAAALAMEAAIRGHKAIVLTIDPARRLASSMGLKRLTDEPSRIKAADFPTPPAGSLDAMMLDTKRTFDRVIERYAPSTESKEAILNNRLYQKMSDMIAGSQEYMAMERLHEIYHEGGYDLIVLDTPPTRNALNFLESPQRMVDMTQNSVLKWFLKPGLFVGHVGYGLFKKSAERILNVFDQLAGFSFLHELADMVSAMAEMIGGFGNRAQQVYNLLRSPKVSFVLVTTPEEAALEDARYFHKQIGQFKLPLGGFIFNRVHPAIFNAPVSRAELARRLEGLEPALRGPLIENVTSVQQLHARHQQRITAFQRQGGTRVFYQNVPYLQTDVHDMKGLAEINKHLFGSGPA